ncbi:aminotransferase class III-fold pyridoxal phosphate-dependent enzyme [Gemmobacter denitrificans]|uniref:Aminotransferase class III-fold pyridoxal phosphate-dependent enzyme n=1 Tax=Gemmobacter denitrificans TaxID=3123040 RepID=A0ABU8BSM6_9RHOB
MTAFTTGNPAFTAKELVAMATTHFGMVGTVRPLPSERDQNARLICGEQDYVLKIANPAEDPGQIDLQTATLRHLARVGQPGIPRVVPTIDGADRATITVAGRASQMRLVTWIAGKPLAEEPRSLPQLANLGRFMGGLTRSMQGFGHPQAFRPDFPWSLDHVIQLRDHVADIADPARRALVERLFLRHERLIAPRLPGLRASVLHQDANDWNVITDPADPTRIAGLIDFGDMCHGRTVNELAITLAYALMAAPDLYAAIRAVISGFAAEFPLTEDEADLVYDIMRMRLVCSVCISSRQSKLHPDNEYLLISQGPAFALLERLERLDPGFMVALCRKAAGFAAIPEASAIVAELGNCRTQPILATDPCRAARIALPTVGGHPDMPAFSDRAFDDWMTAQRPTDLPADMPFVGFGLYGEKRAVYTAAHFADAASDERRTRHLGIDIFAPAGTAIHAPMDGVVESVSYNADPLDYGHTLILRHETASGRAFFTLYGHLGGSLPGLCRAGQAVSAGQMIGHLGDWHENGGWAPHLHFQIITSLLAQRGNFFGVGHDSLWDVWADISPDPNLLLRLEPESFAIDPEPSAALLARRRAVIGPSLSVSYREKLKMVRGRGAWLIDHTGRRYLDTVNNITHVGHCHPHVVQALARQAAELNTNTRYLHEAMPHLAERIAATMPGDLKVVTFVNSGTEANELALRIARTALGKKDTVVLDWAYHGNSGGTVEISPYKFKRKGGFPQPDFVQVAAFPDAYRGPFRGAESGPAYAADIDRCLNAIAQRSGSGAACFIAESLSGVGGQVILPVGYLADVYARIRARGGLCIADEVQCGFGRVGPEFWGFATQGVIPDIVVLGKPIGNGHPLAAVVTTPELAARFANGMEYFNSFGGNPVSMAVGHAVLDVIEAEQLPARAVTTGAALMAGYRGLAERFPIIGDVRGMGLFIGVELVTDRETRNPATQAADHVVDQLRLRGILASTDGPDDNVLKIKPPMVFGPREAGILLTETEAALGSMS